MSAIGEATQLYAIFFVKEQLELMNCQALIILGG
jgi:hypothetical protein